MPTGTPVTGASNAGEVGRNRDSELTSSFSACCQRCNRHVLSIRSPVDHGHRSASCDTSLVVNSGVDCGRRQNFYDKKPQRYAKDNKTAAHVWETERPSSLLYTRSVMRGTATSPMVSRWSQNDDDAKMLKMLHIFAHTGLPWGCRLVTYICRKISSSWR